MGCLWHQQATESDAWGGGGGQGGICAALSPSQALNPCLLKEFAKEAQYECCLELVTNLISKNRQCEVIPESLVAG